MVELLVGDLEVDIALDQLEGCDNLDYDSVDEVAADIDRTVAADQLADLGTVAVGRSGDAEVALVLLATEVLNHAVKSEGRLRRH